MGSKVIKNYLYNVVFQILNVLIPVLTTPYIARVLGADGNGYYSFVNSIVSYFVLIASLGTVTYASREISYVQNDKRRVTVLFWEIQLFRTVVVTLCVICYIIFLLLYPSDIVFLLCGIQIIGVVLDISWLYMGLEEFKSLSIRNIAIKLLCLGAIFIFVHSKSDLWIYVLLSCAVPALSNIVLWLNIHKYVDSPKGLKLRTIRHLVGSLQLFLPTATVHLYHYVDKTMIGIFTEGDFENGYYEQSVKIVKIIQQIITSMNAVVMPRSGKLYEEKNEDAIINIMYLSFNAVWMMGVPLCLGLIAVAKVFIPLFLGEGYENAVALVCVLSCIILIVGFSNIISNQYLIPTKRQNTFTVIVAIGCVINLVLNILLIPRFFALGASIATVISEFIILICELVVVRDKVSLWKIVTQSRNYVISGAIMLCTVLIERHFLNGSIVTLLIMIFSGIVIYFGTLCLLKDKFFIEYVVNRIILRRKGK